MPRLSGKAVVITIGACCFAFILGGMLIASVLGCGDPGDPTVCNSAGSIQGSGLLLMLAAIAGSVATTAIFIKRRLFK